MLLELGLGLLAAAGLAFAARERGRAATAQRDAKAALGDAAELSRCVRVLESELWSREATERGLRAALARGADERSGLSARLAQAASQTAATREEAERLRASLQASRRQLREALGGLERDRGARDAAEERARSFFAEVAPSAPAAR